MSSKYFSTLGSIGRLAIVTLVVSLASAAQALELYEWRPSPELPPIVLPVRDGEAPKAAAERYLRGVETNPDLMRLFDGEAPKLALRNFSILKDTNIDSRALLIANMAWDYEPGHWRVKSFTDHFDKTKIKSYLLPLAADLGLNPEEARQLNQRIIERFPFLVAMGGDDVDPTFYNEENKYSHNTNSRRDVFEFNLIKDYVTAKRGFLFGICRGAQLTASVLGYKLVQDIPKQVGVDVRHSNGEFHPAEVLNTTQNFIQRIFGQVKSIMVNSWHHQSIRWVPGGPLELAARTTDGVTEALESRDGRVFLIQSHPELMEMDGDAKNAADGERIMKAVVEQQKKVHKRTRGACKDLFAPL